MDKTTTVDPRGIGATLSTAYADHALSDARRAARAVLDLLNGDVTARIQQYQALDLGNTIPDELLADRGLTRAQLQAAFATLITIRDLLPAGHATNLWAFVE